MARTIRRASSSSLALAATLVAASCTTVHDVGETQNPVTTCTADDACRLDEVCDSTRKVCLRPPPADQLDILFVIDNSPSMMPLQEALAYNIPRFLSKIDATGADYHVAITTTDVGGLPPGGASDFRLGSCNTRSGDDGVLQAKACSSRGVLSKAATNACARLCPDPKYVPTDGARFISKTGMKSNVPSDFHVDPLTGRTVDYGPANAFKCMAVVGDSGCGVEAPLEAAKRALDGHALENQGFLRPNSLLAVIFITDEDDCSAQDGQRGTLWTPTINCATPSANPPAECFNTNYRCLGKTLRCTEALNTAGTKTRCVEESPSFLSPIAQYTSFLKGLRPSNRLFVGGIWNLGDLARGGRMQVVSLDPGSTSTDQLAAQRRLCGLQDPRFSEAGALPQLRLSKFAQGLRASIEVDLCDIERYPDAIDTMATSILLRAGITPPG